MSWPFIQTTGSLVIADGYAYIVPNSYSLAIGQTLYIGAGSTLRII